MTALIEREEDKEEYLEEQWSQVLSGFNEKRLIHVYWGTEKLWKESFFIWKEEWVDKDALEGSRVGKSVCDERYMREISR